LAFVVFALWLLTPTRTVGQTGIIEGRVVAEDGRPVAGASVRLRGLPNATVTGETGQFVFLRLRFGVYWLEIEALGYAPRSDSLLLAREQALEVEARLTADPLMLPVLVVTARNGPVAAWLASKGFPQRGQADGAVFHATQRQLALQGVRDLAEAIRRIPGVRIRRLVDSGSEILLEPSAAAAGAAPCPVAIYLNGVALGLGRLQEVNFRGQVSRAPRPLRLEDLVPIEHVDGLEFYRAGESPVASESACGTLLIWSASGRHDWDADFTGSVRGKATDSATGGPLRDVRITIQPGGNSVTTRV
jgi:hypothetical protein